MKLDTPQASLAGHPEKRSTSIQIIYATTTGNSQVLAEETAEKLDELGLKYNLCSTEDFSVDQFSEIETLLAFISTDCDGEPPMMADELFQSLRNKTEADLDGLSYSVLSLGDSYYLDFCQAGKDFDHLLDQRGAHRIMERMDCDIGFWDDYDEWLDDIVSKLLGKSKAVRC